MPSSDHDTKFYIDELISEECQCGGEKKSRKSFCWQCFNALPMELQRRIYLPMHKGYEEAYEEAVAHLEGLGRG